MVPWNPDINIAIKQAEVDYANEPDCIGFTTLHKPCLDVNNQQIVKKEYILIIILMIDELTV